MAKNQNDYEIQGREMFLSGQACPNGSSWQQAAMRRGWEQQETTAFTEFAIIKGETFVDTFNRAAGIIPREVSTKNAVVSHIEALTKIYRTSTCLKKVERISNKMYKLQKKYGELLYCN